ncbi:hypothetical protein C1646_758096 [Rhizophagus diaphanus]|nr:hypothetical protein C1646_758096 [Rhizophagus diaphanus] [Rhizophagus sp. MUCL 43196]
MYKNHTIKIKEVPHNGKPITKIEISPQSRYIVTYSQEDKSFVGWYSKACKVIRKKDYFVEYIKNNINSRIGLLLGTTIKDNQDDELNDDNDDDSGPLIVDDKVQPYNLDLDISDYKVSDNKIIMYEGNDELAIIYDMKNKKKITLNSSLKKYTDDEYKFHFPYYKFTNFLTSGDLATYNVIESKGFENQLISRKSVILIYSSNNIKDNSWKCKTTHELDDMNTMEINFGGITNDRLWMLSKNIILILDLFTFQYRKIPLEIKGNVDNKMIELKFFKSLMVISIEGVHFIYSDRMDFIIKIIVRSNLENSIKYNTLIKYFLETNGNSNYFDYFNNIQFRLNDQKVFGIFYKRPWMINIKKCDLETYIINNNYIDSEEINNTKESINENIFYNIGKQFTVTKDKYEFIKKYIIPNLINSNEYQSRYDMRLTRKHDEFILEAFLNNNQNETVSSYKIEYSKNWKYTKNNNAYILFDDTELHIYTFNIEFNKIELQFCYNIKFLKYAIKFYNNKPDALVIEEIKELAQPTDNDGLKKQWILHAISQKYFLVYYGEKLLKSAIKQHNIELIESIYNKTLENFKEDPNNNIYILSLLGKNMPYLNQNYSEFLSKYYDEMNLFADSSNSNMIYNDLQHLYSYFPFPSYVTYPKDYNFLKELLIKPQSSSFSKTQNNDLYKTWNGEAIINFKWRVFGRYYYAGIWILFIIYLTCFTLASIPYDIFNEEDRKKLFLFSIILGFIHLLFEVRQFIWSPFRWISDIWNLFDLSAYLVPVITSIYCYMNGKDIDYTKAISVSCLLLDIKFLLFFRAFESFGIYFAIIIEPKSNFSKSEWGDLNDSNNPWALTKKYHQVTEDGNMSKNATLIEEPDKSTNLFSSYPNSILSMYLFLTGDRNSLSAWSPDDNPLMIILMIIFSFVIVVYLMNLFIGLLNMAIEADNDRASYLAQKALILREIELFYLFPHQRRWKTWFPDIM